jgi:hypothetical protein
MHVSIITSYRGTSLPFSSMILSLAHLRELADYSMPACYKNIVVGNCHSPSPPALVCCDRAHMKGNLKAERQRTLRAYFPKTLGTSTLEPPNSADNRRDTPALALISSDDVILWHNRLGHLHMQSLQAQHDKWCRKCSTHRPRCKKYFLWLMSRA